MEKQTKERQRRKLTGAVTAAVVLSVLLLGMAGLYIWMFQTMDRPPVVLMILYIAAPAACVIGIILALRQRIREIKGGEEDAADQY